MAERARQGSVQHQLMVRALMGGLGELFQTAFLSRFAAIVRDVYFQEGSIIYRQGEPCDHIYFILDGNVTTDAPGETPWRFGRNSLIGILDAQLDRAHNRTATALDDVHALLVTTENWWELMEDHFDLSRSLLGRNSRRLYDFALEAGAHLSEPQTERPSFFGLAPGRRGEGGGQLNLFERLLTLRLSPAFRRAGMQPLIRLARVALTRTLHEGEVLFRAGDKARAMFIVATGQLAVQHGAQTSTFEPGDLVGGFAALVREERAFDATAVSAAAVLELGFDDLDDVMEDHFDVVRSAQAYVAAERERLQRLRAPT